jgi:hypothetical protein
MVLRQYNITLNTFPEQGASMFNMVSSVVTDHRRPRRVRRCYLAGSSVAYFLLIDLWACVRCVPVFPLWPPCRSVIYSAICRMLPLACFMVITPRAYVTVYDIGTLRTARCTSPFCTSTHTRRGPLRSPHPACSHKPRTHSPYLHPCLPFGNAPSNSRNAARLSGTTRTSSPRRSRRWRSTPSTSSSSRRAC